MGNNNYGNTFGDSLNMSDYSHEDKWHGHDGYNDIQIGGALDWITGGFLGTGEEEYYRMRDWDRQCGIMKIEPLIFKQDFSYYSVAYINEGLPYPQIQRIPISDVKVTPHQISFDFFDTTEGKIGVSNATEKHMIVECDIYVTELIYFYWNHAGSENQGHLFGFDGTGGMGAYTGMRFFQQKYDAVNSLIDNVEHGKGNCDIDENLKFNKDGEGLMNWIVTQINPWSYKVYDFEETQAFIDFRNTFLQQFSGWICKFTSQVFGVFDGVITDISYDIESGFTDAKWHVKIEEAIFTEDYSEEGKKADTSDGSQSDSGGIL